MCYDVYLPVKERWDGPEWLYAPEIIAVYLLYSKSNYDLFRSKPPIPKYFRSQLVLAFETHLLRYFNSISSQVSYSLKAVHQFQIII